MAEASQTALLYTRLRSAILALDLAPGERMTERGLEVEFAASRTPVRAALMRLETEGLVQRDGRNWIVAPIDLGEIGALAELREALEVAAARLAVERASDDDIAAVGALLDSFRPLGTEDEGLRMGTDFHTELAGLSGNAHIVSAVAGVVTRLARTRWLEVRNPESRESAWREHRAILDAVASRRADVAADLIAEHIRTTNERLLRSLSADRRSLRARGVAVVE